MVHKLSLGYMVVTCAVVLTLPEASVAQLNPQQMSTNLNQISSPTPARNRIEAATTAHNSALSAVPEDFSKLRLAPGFLVALNVLDDSDFAGEYRVDEQGNIALPVLGAMHVENETPSEVSSQVKKRLLAEQILNNPEVTVTVLEYTAPQVTIIGEVASPGKYPLLAPRNLVDVLSLAGGPTMLAGEQVQITPANRATKPLLVQYSKSSDPKAFEDVLVHPGDIVQVKRAGVVYVLGAVNRPGGYVMQEDGTLKVLQAISLANGTSVVASTGKIYLLRRNEDGTEVNIALSLKKISQGQARDFQLRATDVLYVPTSKMKSIVTNGQGILASAASASIYAGVVY